jgi:hypothetical protein
MARDNVRVYDPVKAEYVKANKEQAAMHEAIVDGTFAISDKDSGPVVTSGVVYAPTQTTASPEPTKHDEKGK